MDTTSPTPPTMREQIENVIYEIQFNPIHVKTAVDAADKIMKILPYGEGMIDLDEFRRMHKGLEEHYNNIEVGLPTKEQITSAIHFMLPMYFKVQELQNTIAKMQAKFDQKEKECEDVSFQLSLFQDFTADVATGGKDAFQQLTALQNSIGYVKGAISIIALLGLFGEAGEVLEEYIKFYHASHVKSYTITNKIRKASKVAKKVDNLKKKIRKEVINPHLPELLIDWDSPMDLQKFDDELADQLYYLNALANNRGKSLGYYAMLSHAKVSARIAKNIADKESNLEMPLNSQAGRCKEIPPSPFSGQIL